MKNAVIDSFPAYNQRRYGTQIDFARWDGDRFTRCDRIGRDKEEG